MLIADNAQRASSTVKNVTPLELYATMVKIMKTTADDTAEINIGIKEALVILFPTDVSDV